MAGYAVLWRSVGGRSYHRSECSQWQVMPYWGVVGHTIQVLKHQVFGGIGWERSAKCGVGMLAPQLRCSSRGPRGCWGWHST